MELGENLLRFEDCLSRNGDKRANAGPCNGRYEFSSSGKVTTSVADRKCRDVDLSLAGERTVGGSNTLMHVISQASIGL
jgi:hypothetical protein